MNILNPSRWVLIFGFLGLSLFSACSTLPEPEFKKFEFPNQNAFIGDVKRPYTKLGTVRVKVNYQSLDANREEKDLCRNYFNKAAKRLVESAKKQGGDAVINVQSVVFLASGQHEFYPTPECSDDGIEGQVLAQGVVVKWVKNKEKVTAVR